jgi:5-methylcytosine-specific restriction endonuclease McrA
VLTPEKERARRRRWAAANREKTRAAEKAWRAAHQGEIRAANSRRYAADPSRKIAASHARRAGAPLRAADVRQLQASGDGICSYCLRPGTSVDHVVPLSRGGGNEPDNLVLACGSCNSKKGQRTPLEFVFGWGRQCL